ncbi:type VI secretion system Vgr family protein [Roseateles depolymerans]|uniref:VgrG protein n=1 Tax=Roseateles depolymerans TaxID=76731 RepID=A0A0U2U6L6_9BURK|nr:type VI secretion system tip protein VgrG [Roseateles depolymerans]ALV07681.1 VgrG protein [Roseateles depolymerans]REG22096.1 type VI secretion system secreted protein VgrG [Roseateles depolymerans]
MPAPTPFRLKTALPEDTLRVHTCTVREALSDLGDTTLTLLSERKDIQAAELLGKQASLTVALRDDVPRHVSGYVSRFARSGFEGKYSVYQMTLKPWPWLLTRTADCRIFQEMTVPDIVKQVFDDHPVARFELKLMRPYRTWNYCVQYRETDFNFIARLLEHEGIYWYIEHDESGHKMVLCDSASAHDAVPTCATLPFYGGNGQVPPQLEHVSQWANVQCVQPGKVVITDYDFQRPSSSLQTSQARKRDYDLSDGEIFDYPGGYIQNGDGAQYAEDRLDELQSAYDLYDGVTNAQGVHTGHLVSLSRHPNDDQNIQYLVTSTSLHLRQAVSESGSGSTDLSCSFHCIPAAQQYRPTRRTPKPVVPGPQTAIVTGPAGEEIHTDKFGRVKVQFHWDRRGQRNEQSSCWVSVAHPWAGSNFGGVHIPRIGQEVIVGFLEGDPDAPIIIGRTYNGENLPPWDLPANATQSGFLTRSTKGGGYGNANAIRFEDKKGEEQVWIHAEKNQDIEVENDETHWVGRDRTKTIDRHETTLVKGNRTETVNLDETITVHQNRTERVDLDEKISIGLNRTEDVGVNETISIGSNRSVTIGGMKSETVALAKAETIGLGKALTIGAAYQTSVGGLMNTTVGLQQSEQVGLYKKTLVGKDYSINSGAVYSVQAKDEIHLTVGKASLTMKSDGTIIINGHTLSVGTTGEQTFKADGEVTMKGKQILEN